MKCPYCGTKIHRLDNECIECGRKIDIIKEDKGSAFFVGLFSLLFPLLGLVLYFLYRDTYKRKSRICLRNAIIGFVIYIGIVVLLFLFWLFILIGILTI